MPEATHNAPAFSNPIPPSPAAVPLGVSAINQSVALED
jgi:hypothetical protein